MRVARVPRPHDDERFTTSPTYRTLYRHRIECIERSRSMWYTTTLPRELISTDCTLLRIGFEREIDNLSLVLLSEKSFQDRV